MESNRVFRTKTGYCHILPDKIVLTRNGIIGDVSNIIVGNGIWRILIIYGILSIVFLYFAYTNLMKSELVVAMLYSLVSAFLLIRISKSLNNSATPIIDRNKIKNVKFHSAKTGLTRAYFEIFFEDGNGKMKNRLIMLPGSLNNGESETQKAVLIMEDEKLLNDR